MVPVGHVHGPLEQLLMDVARALYALGGPYFRSGLDPPFPGIAMGAQRRERRHAPAHRTHVGMVEYTLAASWAYSVCVRRAGRDPLVFFSRAATTRGAQIWVVVFGFGRVIELLRRISI